MPINPPYSPLGGVFLIGQGVQRIIQLKSKKLALFVYRCRKINEVASRQRVEIAIRRKLHGYTDIRASRGGGVCGTPLTAVRRGETVQYTVQHKKYCYSGIPHYAVAPGTFLVERKYENELTGFFREHRIPFFVGCFRLLAACGMDVDASTEKSLKKPS